MGKWSTKCGTWGGMCRFLTVSAPLAALLLSFGCAGSTHRPSAASTDPLAGGVPTPAGGPSASAVPPPTPVAPTVPPLPVSTGTQSLAALASGAAPKPLDPSRELRIGTPVSSPDAVKPQATLIPPAAPAPSQPVARGLAPAGIHVGTFEQAQVFLASRGVKWQSLQTWGDQGAWKFSCSIPNSKNPYISRTYEGQARDSLAAIQAVIDQIERDGSSGF